jgi:predicted MFS family arabinose efflux permease
MSSNGRAWNRVLGLAAVVGGLGIGWMDTHNDEASVTIVVLLVFSSLVGCLDRMGTRRAWLWALLIGIWMPVLSYSLPILGLAPVNPGLPRTAPSYAALTAVVMAVCLIGAYAGAWIGRTVRQAP